MRLTMKRGPGRYAALIVGLGAAGVAIGWLGDDMAALLTGSAPLPRAAPLPPAAPFARSARSASVR